MMMKSALKQGLRSSNIPRLRITPHATLHRTTLGQSPLHRRQQTGPRRSRISLCTAMAIASTPAFMDLAYRDPKHAKTGVAVVTTVGCPHCKRTKDTLHKLKLTFDEIELSRDLKLLKAIKDHTKQSTVPQVFVGGEMIGGATELHAMVESGQLEQLLTQHSGKPALPDHLAKAVEDAKAEEGSNRALLPGQFSAERYAALTDLSQRLRGRLFDGASTATADRSFSRQQALDALGADRSGAGPDAEAALEDLLLAQTLTLEQPSDSHWSQQLEARLRFVADSPKPRLGDALNAHYSFYGPPRPAPAVAEALRLRVLGLYERHLAPGGHALDYKALGADPDFSAFVDATAELQKVDVGGLGRAERMAFWINIYNILVVHALVALGPAEGTLGRLRWFANIAYIVGGQRFSSNDVEHGVLRGNRPSPANVFSLLGLTALAPKTFQPGDPRLPQVIHPLDPRIHFALVCGARSCPPIKVYSAETLEEGLHSAALAFVQSEVEVHPERRELVLSKIFQWYGGDFGSRADLLTFLLRHMAEPQKSRLHDLIDGEHDVALRFKPYDWSLNGV